MKLKKNEIIVFIILFMSIFPVINFLGFTMPILYLLIPLELILLVLILLGKTKVVPIIKYIIFIFMFIMCEIFISTIYGSIINIGHIEFPTELLQYLARLLILLVFTYISYNEKVDYDKLIKYILIIFTIGMLIGLLQWIPWPGRELMVKLYPFRDGAQQLEHLSRDMVNIRVHGIAQFATANGGIAVLFFVIGYSVYKYYRNYRKIALSLMILSIINIFASQSRGGQLAFISVIVLLYIIDIYIYRKSIKPTIYMIITVVLGYFVGWILYINENPIVHKMIYRWNDLIVNNGGDRIGQIEYFMSKIINLNDFLFGISKQAINISNISYGIEIEPINIFISYGLIGFLAHYFLIFFIFRYLLKSMRICKDNKICIALLVTSFVGLAGYQVFSVAYFFFREIRVGLYMWILIGVTIGVVERYKNRKFIKLEI